MTPRLLAHAVVVGVILALAATARAGDETCYPIEVTWYSPSGVAGCTLDGPTDGIASTYPGDVAAANWCVFPWTDCGYASVQSHTTGLTITVPVAMYCDCYTNTSDERLIDLTPGQVAALGLDAADGLFDVVVAPIEQPEQGETLGASLAAGSMTPAPVSLPDTAAERKIDSGEQANGYTSMVGVATNTDNMRAARIGATPPVRAVRHSGVDE